MGDITNYGDYQSPSSDQNYGDVNNPPSVYTDSKNDPSPYSAKDATKPDSSTESNSIKPANGEVTILATFVWKPAITDEQEVKYSLANTWNATTVDFSEITGQKISNGPGDLIALMGMIAQYAPKSIKRLNFFTHSNDTQIGIFGTVDNKNVYFSAIFSTAEMYEYTNPETIELRKFNNKFTLGDVRARFTDDAIFVLYGCDIGKDPEVLPNLVNLLKVTVIGFKARTVYCTPWQMEGSKVFNRKGEKMGIDKTGFNCKTDSTTDWRSLINDPNAVRFTK